MLGNLDDDTAGSSLVLFVFKDHPFNCVPELQSGFFVWRLKAALFCYLCNSSVVFFILFFIFTKWHPSSFVLEFLFRRVNLTCKIPMIIHQIPKLTWRLNGNVPFCVRSWDQYCVCLQSLQNFIHIMSYPVFNFILIDNPVKSLNQLNHLGGMAKKHVGIFIF